MTPAQIRDAVLLTVGEPEGIFHTADAVAAYTQHAEQLLMMKRTLNEKTVTLSLVYNQALYAIHATAPDFIYPLRVTLMKKQLFQTSLSRIATADPHWLWTPGEPRQFFMVGCSLLGIYPTPPSDLLNVQVTYIAPPPVVQGATPFTVQPEWHETLANYPAAILLAKEQKYDLATAYLQPFLSDLGLPRDHRQGPPEEKGTRMREPLHPTLEPRIG